MLEGLFKGEINYFPEELNNKIEKESIKLIKENRLLETNIIKVKQVVCDYFNLTEEEFITKTRKRKYSYPRSIFWYICYRELKISLEDISKIGWFERDNIRISSANFAINHHLNPEMKKNITEIRQKLGIPGKT